MKSATFKLISAVMLLLGFAAPSLFGAELHGHVVGVLDGDTIDLLTAGKEVVRVRLSGIDAPEKKQPFGQQAKKVLSDFVFDRDVVVQWHKHDRYKRTIGQVFLGPVDVNLRMVQLGYAWHYKNFEKEQTPADRQRYAAAERDARGKRAGLWLDKSQIAPWDFRKSKQR